MKTCLRYIMTMMTVMLCSLSSVAADTDEAVKNDSVYFYYTWEQMLNFEPELLLLNPHIYSESPFSVSIWTDDQSINEELAESGFVAVSIGEDVWLLSSLYLKENFKGDVNIFDGLVPLFFNPKMAFLTYPGELSVKDIFFGGDSYNDKVSYYHINFEKKTVKKVTHKYLSELLEDYHDLQMRYEGMKDYKKNEIIEDFYFKYIDRATQDFMHPYITDFVE